MPKPIDLYPCAIRSNSLGAAVAPPAIGSAWLERDQRHARERDGHARRVPGAGAHTVHRLFMGPD